MNAAAGQTDRELDQAPGLLAEQPGDHQRSVTALTPELISACGLYRSPEEVLAEENRQLRTQLEVLRAQLAEREHQLRVAERDRLTPVELALIRTAVLEAIAPLGARGSLLGNRGATGRRQSIPGLISETVADAALRAFMLAVMPTYNWNQTEAAQALRMADPGNVSRLLKRLDIRRERK